MDSDSVKKEVIRQALQQANMTNARTLIEVCTFPPAPASAMHECNCMNAMCAMYMLTSLAEHQRQVLRTVYPQARQLPVERRADLPDPVHGEVHGGLERSKRDIHPEDTAGGWEQLPQRIKGRRVSVRELYNTE